ncbi:Acetyltransferase (GNAT) domain-containing protein [Brevibacterium sandarakinum]|uniref:Acetyltransferase (GNAT) domain-containing protein n=3 Tax=Brevibacteriaceae TaxID=85019 RepID=A0A1H1TCM2_BRESA|nr:Acetyltransferase (GNAT) domain-containing protein [Brevibacterium sandarakinum]
MSGVLSVLNADVEADRSVWSRLWAASPMQSPFAHPDVCRLLSPGRATLMAAVWTEDSGHILYPFFMRSIEGPTRGGDGRFELRDIISPYGYGGPLHWGLADAAESAARFWADFDSWARDNNVVSEFLRCSLFDEELLPYPGRLRQRQTNFVRDLTVSAEELWTGVLSKVRRNVRRAKREGVSAVIDTEGELIDEFLRIYLSTMDRRSSAQWYRFDREFFAGLHAALPGKCAYVFAQHEGRLISVDLLLLGADAGYYFLGGTDEAAFSVRPNDFVKWEVMNWLHERKYRNYVLGGGVRSDDGLERYKRGFAPDGGVAFLTGERVFATEEYERLTAARRAGVDESGLTWDEEFFPAYRQGPDSVAESDFETVRM